MFPERLSQGYRAFLDGRFAAERSRYEMLAEARRSSSACKRCA
jgi:carbonic anhydrase